MLHQESNELGKETVQTEPEKLTNVGSSSAVRQERRQSQRRRSSLFQSIMMMKKQKKKKKTKKKSSKKTKENAKSSIEVLDYSKQRDSDNDVLRHCLGMDNYGMCLKHPDQTILLPSTSSNDSNSHAEEVLLCSQCSDPSMLEESSSTIHRRILQRREWDVVTIQLNRNPFFVKYFAMLEARVPLKEVQHICYIDRQHPLVLELDPNQSIQGQVRSKKDEDDDQNDSSFALQHSVEQANLRFMSTNVDKTAQQVERALRRRVIAASVSVAIEESVRQFRKKQRLTFQKGVARLINVHRFLKIAKRSDLLLFDDQTGSDFNNHLRTHLGMDGFGMCLRHPNNTICSESSARKLAPVQSCRICKSEQLAGGNLYHPQTTKDLKSVIGQIQKLQHNKKEWHQRTNVMYHGREFDEASSSNNLLLDETTAYETVPVQLPNAKEVSVEEWKCGILDRLQQVRLWNSKKSNLRNNPVYAKYFRLLEIGVPLQAVKQTALLDGWNEEILDLDPNDAIENQRNHLTSEAARKELDQSLMKNDNGSTSVENLEHLFGIVDQSFDKRLIAMKLERHKASTEKIIKKKKKKDDKTKKTKKSSKASDNQEQSADASNELPNDGTSLVQEEKKKRKLRLKKKVKRFLKSDKKLAIEKITKEMEKQQTTIDKLEAELAQKDAIIASLQLKIADTKDLERKLEC
eukprot:scaffold19016_cov147-Cylindrotheca_fusiformis.AAC.1